MLQRQPSSSKRSEFKSVRYLTCEQQIGVFRFSLPRQRDVNVRTWVSWLRSWVERSRPVAPPERTRRRKVGVRSWTLLPMSTSSISLIDIFAGYWDCSCRHGDWHWLIPWLIPWLLRLLFNMVTGKKAANHNLKYIEEWKITVLEFKLAIRKDINGQPIVERLLRIVMQKSNSSYSKPYQTWAPLHQQLHELFERRDNNFFWSLWQHPQDLKDKKTYFFWSLWQQPQDMGQ